MARESSPEERLLNLIKSKRKSKASPENKNIGIAMPSESPISNVAKENITSSAFLEFDNIMRLENIKRLNLILFIVLILIILYFLIDIFIIPSKELTLLEEDFEKEPKVIEEIEIKPYSYYSKGLQKEVFKQLVKEGPKISVPSIPVEELMGNLSLLGIVSGENPQAIIEDKKQRKTFFLRQGQSAGGIFLKRIEDGTATVVYKGEEFILAL